MPHHTRVAILVPYHTLLTLLRPPCPQVMVSKVSSLLKTVKNVEDEAGRGVRSLENTIDAIEDALVEYNSPNPPKVNHSPEDLIRSTKALTLASAKVGLAGGGSASFPDRLRIWE